MSHNRKRLLNRLLLGALATSLALPSSAGAAPVVHQSEATGVVASKAVSAEEDGRHLFTAYFFGVGPSTGEVRKALASVVEMPSEMNASSGAQRATTIIVQTIAERSPKLFASFGADMRSGDAFRVDAALREANAELLAALSTNGTATGEAGTGQGAVAVAVQITVAVRPAVVSHAVADNHAAAVKLDAVTSALVEVTLAKAQSGQFTQEHVTAALATALKG